eukprot:TRINITY_DN4601_c0_g1_i2.p1 TRINITY_DN4601_c0_g1~~TRINITY_DN4601_c0_g1_i2.p1  ORF type:complete len:173 (-),score=19.52 TRINITY_DN4601_c0_g1_i2:745-1263(-)
MCKFFLANKCERGNLCSYAHSQDELRPPPDLSGTQLCPAIMEGRACKDYSCRFAHSAAEVKRFPGGSKRDEVRDRGLEKETEDEVTCYEFFGVCLRNTFLTWEDDKAGTAVRRTCSAPGRLNRPQEYATESVADKGKDLWCLATPKKQPAKTVRASHAVGPLPAGRVNAISR